MGNRPLKLALGPGEHFTASSESEPEGVALSAVYRASAPNSETPPTGTRQHPTSPQHSRLQHCEEGVRLQGLGQLAALLPAQPDNVTERLGSVGLPLQRQGHGAPSGPGRVSTRQRTEPAARLLGAGDASKPGHS